MQLIAAVMHLNDEPGVICGVNVYAIQTKCGAVFGMIFIAGTSNARMPPGMPRQVWVHVWSTVFSHPGLDRCADHLHMQYDGYQATLARWMPVWQSELGLPDPDMIVINQNMWELQRSVRCGIQVWELYRFMR